jgi:peptidoglycan/xylan/chitin deacetylase (PgdA/CDA1 family)
MRSLYLLLRNLFCGSLAVAVIASGRVRRAKKRVLNSNVVTAIYFHNPNKKLFARCVRWLSKNGYTFISHDELIEILHRGIEPPKGAVWLSFDDGFKELLEAVVPLVRKRHVPITLFVPTGIVDGNGLFPWLHQTTDTTASGGSDFAQNGARESITVADVKEIARYPEVSIGSHAVGHRVTVNLSDENARHEFEESKGALESWTGGAITTFAYPEGRLDGRESLLLAECGYQLAATTETTFVTQGTDPYLVPRFHVGDDFSLPEAICNMVGVWRPVIDPLIHVVRSCSNLSGRLRHPSRRQYGARRETSV